MSIPLACSVDLEVLLELSVGSPVGQLRAIPVQLGPQQPRTILLVYGADFDDDPSGEMFFFPKDTLKLMLVSERGEILWRRDLGRGVVPGVWFCPVFAFDLDQDGVDEIWFLNNRSVDHPLAFSHFRLERIMARTGETKGQWPWPNLGGYQALSMAYRNFIFGGHVRGEPVLVTAQGTYGSMFFQARRPDMSLRWEHRIDKDSPGARGSHMCPITDLDGDGVEEVMWGERCIELGTGREVFCADRDRYRGHSDVIQPVLNRASGRWGIFTCRESDQQADCRVAMFDDHGNRVWGRVDKGHMDMGWVAHIEDEPQPIAMAIRIGHKTCGPEGRIHYERDEHTFRTENGEPYPLPFSAYGTLPVDVNGDGYHEFVRGVPGQNGDVLDQHGEIIGQIGGTTAMLSQFMPHPGEQILAYYPDGLVRVWGDRQAKDSETALARYANPFYKSNQRLTAVGANLHNLGGL